MLKQIVRMTLETSTPQYLPHPCPPKFPLPLYKILNYKLIYFFLSFFHKLFRQSISIHFLPKINSYFFNLHLVTKLFISSILSCIFNETIELAAAIEH